MLFIRLDWWGRHMKTFSERNLDQLYRETPPNPIPRDRPTVIFSDFHLGDGSRRDDFLHNSDLTMNVLEEYYRRGFRLLLNGDVEELQKFSLEKIKRRWADLYAIFDRFRSRSRLIRLVGNHDLDLLDTNDADTHVYRAVHWQRGDAGNTDDILIYHGHQASRRYELYNRHVGWTLRNVVSKLPLRNYSVSHDDTKKMLLEERIYRFSGDRRILSIIGHTHRPLFESLSKTDWVKYNIERLCRQHASADRQDRQRIRREIEELKAYVARTVPDQHKDVGSIYHDTFVVPCVFNSGCVLGKRGITCLELTEKTISLKYWFDRNRSRRYLRYDGYESIRLPGTDYFETVIQAEQLDYVFSRIHLLGGREEFSDYAVPEAVSRVSQENPAQREYPEVSGDRHGRIHRSSPSGRQLLEIGAEAG